MSLYSLIRPLIFCFDAETAHGLAVTALKSGLLPRCAAAEDPVLVSTLWGLRFPTPVGLAAGFDKNAEVPDAMLAQGFGFVEAGTVTPRPQEGNPKPRMFRLSADRAVINRLGFNNAGLEAFRAKAEARQGRPGIFGANVGANKDTSDPVSDYVAGIRALYGLSDYFTVNISSPNTPGLRSLQRQDALDRLLGAVMAARLEAHGARSGRLVPLLVKIAPDLSPEERADIAKVALKHEVDGLIISNTTISRPAGLHGPFRGETGGLSGQPLLKLATEVLGDMYKLTEGRIPLVGVGGIENGQDAYRKIRAGASLVQLYSAMVYEGPGLGASVAQELANCLRADGYANVSEAVGADWGA
ncbi:quinone-dependent dihydroorotate dehydrogenase [Govanella unica]|uniref:Dihydroorotate dehydrogenase (quinone) n=1 Tax=Govanella unica TaxID=2975056 RepID=A0A9X3TZY3_9PROT|nr:quinone-dependent dihydroorotate dehydrogenase [Govania unica]MDA5194693.1 quinone-dependent dihydroorotate dehydrogenase [Govania unica]